MLLFFLLKSFSNSLTNRHCGQRVPCWAILLLLSILAILLVVLVVLAFTVIAPAIINKLMDDSVIEFEHVRLTRPGNDSLYLEAKCTNVALSPTGVGQIITYTNYRQDSC